MHLCYRCSLTEKRNKNKKIKKRNTMMSQTACGVLEKFGPYSCSRNSDVRAVLFEKTLFFPRMKTERKNGNKQKQTLINIEREREREREKGKKSSKHDPSD